MPSKPTDGPLEVCDEMNIVATRSRRGIAVNAYSSTDDGAVEESIANMQLASAAPDLYDALAHVLRMHQESYAWHMPPFLVEKINAALRKARPDVYNDDPA